MREFKNKHDEIYDSIQADLMTVRLCIKELMIMAHEIDKSIQERYDKLDQRISKLEKKDEELEI